MGVLLFSLKWSLVFFWLEVSLHALSWFPTSLFLMLQLCLLIVLPKIFSLKVASKEKKEKKNKSFFPSLLDVNMDMEIWMIFLESDGMDEKK